MTGYTRKSDFQINCATVKYDLSGNPLWVTEYSGSGRYDDPRAVTVDTAGNVYVTGISNDYYTGDNYATVKYDPNGNQLWETKYIGPIYHGRVAALAVDANGNIFVTGTSQGSGGATDYATVKYSQVPKVSDVTVNSFWVFVNTNIMLSALVDNTSGTNSNIASAEYNVDDGDWLPMSAKDGAFDSPSESVTATLKFAQAGEHTVCVRGTDILSHTSAEECPSFTVIYVGVSEIMATPNPAPVNTDVTLSALIDSASQVASAEYNVDGGDWLPMSAVDGAFGSPSERVTATLKFTRDGRYTVCVRGTDGSSNTSGDCTDVFVEGIQPPIVSDVTAAPNPAQVNTDLTLSALIAGTGAGSAHIASAQYNVDGGDWMPMSAVDGAFDSPSESVTATLKFAQGGEHTVCVRGTDGLSNTSAEACTGVKVIDTIKPTITSLSANPRTLWPANNKMVPVSVAVSATDNNASAPLCKISSVSSNEAGNGDWQVTGNLTLNLRAKREGSGSGRVYTITVQCTDDAGNSATGTTTVTVPHDQGK